MIPNKFNGQEGIIFLTLFYFLPNFLFSQVDTAWVRRYNYTNWDFANAITIDNNGNLYVTGGSCGIVADIATIKYDRNGNQLWVKRYNGPGNNWDEGKAIAVDNNGNVYVTGVSYGNGTGEDYVTIKYNSAGSQQWVARYNSGEPRNADDAAFRIALDSDGNVYVTGRSYTSSNDDDYLTIKYNQNGNLLWSKRYNGPASSCDCPHAMVIDNNGNLYVTGASMGAGTNYDFATIKYDRNGNQIWVKRYNGPRNDDDWASAIAVDNFGNIYVGGMSKYSDTLYDYIIVKYDANGNELWVRGYNGPGNGDDYVRAIAVDNEGNLYVTGGSYGGSQVSWDYATIKYDQNGNELWVRRYNGPGNNWDEALALVIDNNGNAYVTGYSEGISSGGDITTIKYDRNGNQIWVTRYNGPGNNTDEGRAIIIDNNYNIYITGRSVGAGTDEDYVTIKYIQQPSINEEKTKRIKEKTKYSSIIYEITGKIVKGRKLKKGIYFRKTEKGIEKILILK